VSCPLFCRTAGLSQVLRFKGYFSREDANIGPSKAQAGGTGLH